MDVIVSEDQQILQDSTRRFLEDRTPIHSLRKHIDSGSEFSPADWQQAAAQGWLTLFIPEAHGGFAESAGGLIDAAIIAEEMGRVVYAGPFLSNCIAAFAIANYGSASQKSTFLEPLGAGECQFAWCYAGAGTKGGIAANGVNASSSEQDVVLNGVAANVQDANLANYFLVSAQGDRGVRQFIIAADTPGLRIKSKDALDLGRRIADVEFTNVKVCASSGLGGESCTANDDNAFERQLQHALVLQAAETVGVVDRVMEFTLDYVQQRFAFGRAIGSFQALKHRLADHATQLEGAKALVARAATAVQQQATDAAITASIANSHCGRFGTEIVRDCLHMHGGIGMTWEHDIHFYLRRAVSNEALLGTPAVHHERLCQLAGL